MDIDNDPYISILSDFDVDFFIMKVFFTGSKSKKEMYTHPANNKICIK